MVKRHPPYSRAMRKNLSGDIRRYWGTSPDGKSPSLFLLCGSDAWDVARQWKSHRLLTLLPPGGDPAGYDWRMLKDADPLLLWRCGTIEGDEVQALLVAVMTDGIERVLDVASGLRYVREYVNAA